MLPVRKTYRFSHSVGQGGTVYAQKIQEGKIHNKEGLRNMLNAVVKRYRLIDATVKVYDDIFFFFFHARNVKPTDLIGTVHEHLPAHGRFAEEYVYSGVYDLQEEYVRKELKDWGYDYDAG